jgi:hypothetical protein
MSDSKIQGERLLVDVHTAIRKYCVLPGTSAYTAVTLWCAYTHLADAFHYAPRLIARSPHKRSGKTRLYEVVAELVRSPLRSTDASTPFIFRSLDANPRQTVMLDEVDAAFGVATKAAQNEDLRALLNAGFQRGGTVGRVSGPNLTPTNYVTFAPAFLAGIGRMPDTVEDRAVVIEMRRKTASEHVQPFRPSRDRVALNEIRDRLDQWATALMPTAQECAEQQQVELPVDDRAADVWEPLLVVAHLAGGNWPERGCAACVELVSKAGEDDTDSSPGQLLLQDIQAIMELAFMPSADLCAALNALPESPWGAIPLTPHRLGQRLKPYGIKTRHIADRSRRGYHRVDFEDAWHRYLPPTPSETVQSVRHSAEYAGLQADSPLTVPSGERVPSGLTSTSAGAQDASDAFGRASDPEEPERCADCGAIKVGSTGKCVVCIVDRATAAAR